MNQASIAKAASLLADARRTRLPLTRLPEEARPQSFADAHAIEDALVAMLDERVAGYKVARVPVPDGEIGYGLIVESRVVASGGTVDARDMPLLGMEAEIAFRFLEDVPRRDRDYTYDEVARRVVAFPAIEIVATRYADYKTTPVIERLADFMSNGGFVAGAENPDWRAIDLVQVPVSLTFDDVVIVERSGGHPLGDPLVSAIDLVNKLRATTGVRAGQFVTTGAYTGLNFAKQGQRVSARFSGFNVVEVTVA